MRVSGRGHPCVKVCAEGSSSGSGKDGYARSCVLVGPLCHSGPEKCRETESGVVGARALGFEVGAALWKP